VTAGRTLVRRYALALTPAGAGNEAAVTATAVPPLSGGPGNHGSEATHAFTVAGSVGGVGIRPAEGQVSANTVAPPVAARLFAGQLAAHAERLREYEDQLRRLEGRHGGPPPASHPEFGSYATLTYGIGRERHRIDWLEWMIAHLE
jgi:hypothetical protein